MTEKELNDSKEETKQHITRVQTLLEAFAYMLECRGKVHDQSKLLSPEAGMFAEFGPKLKASTYGSKEYEEMRELMGPALRHHYANNRHHPEFHENGIDGMNLVDIIEMFMDWKAGSERHDTGDIYKSIKVN